MSRHPSGRTCHPAGSAGLARFRVPLAVTALTLLAVVAPGGAAWAAPPEPDATFLSETHQSNLAEIEAGRDGQINGVSLCVWRVGAVLVKDHQKLDAQLKPVADRLGVKLASEPTKAQRDALGAVKAKAGSPGYDTAWLNLQEKEHRQTLGRIDKELSQGKDDSVKAVARGARPVIQMHLQMVQGGKCRTSSGATSVGAGDGGQAARAVRLREFTGTGLLGVGLVLVAAGSLAVLRRRRT